MSDGKMPANLRRTIAVASLAGAAFALGGCGMLSDETAANWTRAPGNYSAYPCPNILREIDSTRTRITELEQLMTAAKQDAGGEVFGALAYRSEHIQYKGRLSELMRASADKQCAMDSDHVSRRSVY